MSEPTENVNPCMHKKQCRRCRIVGLRDRPSGCITIVCPDYTPCEQCKMNRPLLNDGLCRDCSSPSQRVKDEKLHREDTETADISDKVVSITHPGTAPVELSPPEVAYYNKRWAEYRGYYRSPSSFQVCHQMVLEEINLNYINSQLLQARESLNKAMQNRQQASIRMLKDLRAQLPEKEAEDISDDEKSLAGIYERYIAETGLAALGKVSRILTMDACCLGQVLPHRLDIRSTLQACGFEVVTIEDALHRYNIEATEKLDIDELMKFLGFRLNEKYALPFTGIEEQEYAPEVRETINLTPEVTEPAGLPPEDIGGM